MTKFVQSAEEEEHIDAYTPASITNPGEFHEKSIGVDGSRSIIHHENFLESVEPNVTICILLESDNPNDDQTVQIYAHVLFLDQCAFFDSLAVLDFG